MILEEQIKTIIDQLEASDQQLFQSDRVTLLGMLKAIVDTMRGLLTSYREIHDHAKTAVDRWTDWMDRASLLANENARLKDELAQLRKEIRH